MQCISERSPIVEKDHVCQDGCFSVFHWEAFQVADMPNHVWHRTYKNDMCTQSIHLRPGNNMRKWDCKTDCLMRLGEVWWGWNRLVDAYWPLLRPVEACWDWLKQGGQAISFAGNMAELLKGRILRSRILDIIKADSENFLVRPHNFQKSLFCFYKWIVCDLDRAW